MSTKTDIHSRIVEVLHEKGFAWDGDGYPDRWAVDIATVITDLIIDLAGTGQLLASIDQIART